MKALVADSLPKGERSGGFTKLFVASLLPRSVGPLISVVMFSRLGDDWSMDSIRTVFTVGLALNAPVVLLMCLFDDAAVLADDDAAVPPELETLDEEAAPTGGAPPGPTGCWGALGRQHIPYILFCSDFFVYVGAGMTVKFFPLYFKNAVGLSPAAVQVSTCCRRAGRSGGLTKKRSFTCSCRFLWRPFRRPPSGSPSRWAGCSACCAPSSSASAASSRWSSSPSSCAARIGGSWHRSSSSGAR